MATIKDVAKEAKQDAAKHYDMSEWLQGAKDAVVVIYRKSFATKLIR